MTILILDLLKNVYLPNTYAAKSMVKIYKDTILNAFTLNQFNKYGAYEDDAPMAGTQILLKLRMLLIL